jgi:hypothetical protein
MMIVRMEFDPILSVRVGGALKHTFVTTIVFAFLMTTAAVAAADTIWDEGVDGLLSTNPASPTVVTLVSPSDLVIGGGPGGLHVFGFTVPAGKTVSSMIIDSTTGWLTVEVVSAAINCPPRSVIATSVEMLDGVSCAPALPPGDYTFIVDVDTPPQAWNVTIASDVPVELLSLTVE